MNLYETILNSLEMNPDLVLYAKLIDGKLQPTSEVALLELNEEELELNTEFVAQRKCPGFTY